MIGKCAVCDVDTKFHINGMAACIDHAESVMRLAIQLEAVEVGADPEQVERVIAEMLADMRGRL